MNRDIRWILVAMLASASVVSSIGFAGEPGESDEAGGRTAYGSGPPIRIGLTQEGTDLALSAGRGCPVVLRQFVHQPGQNGRDQQTESELVGRQVWLTPAPQRPGSTGS